MLEQLEPPKATLETIERTKAQVTVEVDTAFGWVSIKPIDSGEEVFLQDHEAESFIQQSRATYELGCLSLCDCYLLQASEYLDVVFHSW